MNSSSNDLLSWLRLFWNESDDISYGKISDAYFLNEVFREIDPNAGKNDAIMDKENGADFFKNWDILIKNIRIYYTVVLQQALLIRSPSVLVIFHDNSSERSVEEMNKAIFLILGAAVQCERKEYFINDIISRLSDASIQHGLMGFIKQITEDTDTVISYLNLDNMPNDQIVQMMRKLTDDWETSFVEDSRIAIERFSDLMRQVSEQHKQIQVLRNVGMDNGHINVNTGTAGTGSNNSLSSQAADKVMMLELAESKARVRKLQNELDDKNDLIADLKDELDVQQEENDKLKENQTKLLNDSRKVRMLQDELDSQKESIIKMEILENENSKLKEKVNDLEYYKARCEELRYDLAILSEENQNIIDKLEMEKSNTKVLSLEADCKRLAKKVEDQKEVITGKQEEIQSLQDEIFLMHEKDSINLSNRNELQKRLAHLDSDKNKGDSDDRMRKKSLSDQLMERTSDELIRLKSENRSLKADISALTNNSNLSYSEEREDELKQEIKQLKEQISRLKESNKREIENGILEKENTQLVTREKLKLENKIQTIKEDEQRRVKELLQEIESLNDTILSLRERSEKSNDLRINDLEKNNDKLHTALNEANHKLSKFEFDLQQQTQKSKRLDASLEKAQQEYLQLSKDNEQLNKEVAAGKFIRTSLEEIKKKYSDLELEKSKLESVVTQYNYEMQQKKAESNSKVQDNLQEIWEDNQKKVNQLNSRLKEMDNELVKTKSDKEKVERELNLLNRKFKLTNEELEKSRAEIIEFNKLESKLKLSLKAQADLETERETLQTTNIKLEQEWKKLERDYKKLKSQCDVQLASIDKYRGQLSEYEVKIHKFEIEKSEEDDVKVLKKSLIDSEQKFLDLEQKNRELYQRALEEKRKSDTLRQELLNEKLEKQSVKEELHRLKDDFSKLDMTEDDSHSEKINELEQKLNSTVGESMKKKEEKIKEISSKLTSSLSKNKELMIKLEDLENNYNLLEQKYEEELANNSVREKKASGQSTVSTYAKYLNELKDRLISLERENAQLSTGKQYLQSTCDELNEKMSKSEEKNKTKIDNLEKKVREEMSNGMKWKIELSTLQTQMNTVREDNTNLSQQIAALEKNLYLTKTEVTSLKTTNEKLESQCVSLKEIDDKLSKEYEEAKIELSHQKGIVKTLKTDMQKFEKESYTLKRDAEKVKQLKDILETEKGSHADSAKFLITIRQENQNLSSENQELLKMKSKLELHLRSVIEENKVLKSEKNKEKEYINNLLDDNMKLEQTKQYLDKNRVKLEEKIDNLVAENERLIEDNRKLLQQMRAMLTQNHELLTETLQNRAEHYTEESALKDRLNQLQRQKERLEEKIMEQYKYIQPAKKPKGGRNKFLKKARDMLKRRDSKTDLTVTERKSPTTDTAVRTQRSRSCVAMFSDDPQWFEPVRPNSTFINDSTNTVATVPSGRKSLPVDSDTNSLLSSLGRHLHPNQSLQPGSMSIYDRGESETQYTSNMANWLNGMNERPQTVTYGANERERSHQNNNINNNDNYKNNNNKNSNNNNNNNNNNTNSGYQSVQSHNKVVQPVMMRHQHSTPSPILKHTTSNAQRPSSVLEKPNRKLPNQPKQLVGNSDNSHTTSGPVTFGSISSKAYLTSSDSSQTSPVKPNRSSSNFGTSTVPRKLQAPPAPSVPVHKKSSLPYTDRSESDISTPELQSQNPMQQHQLHHQQQQRKSEPAVVPPSAAAAAAAAAVQRSNRTTATTPMPTSSSTSFRTINSSMAGGASGGGGGSITSNPQRQRPSSTVPSSATSREIIRRLKSNHSVASSSSTAAGSGGGAKRTHPIITKRPSTPNSELNINVTGNVTHRIIRPQSTATTSYSDGRVGKSAAASVPASAPAPPVRRESAHKVNHHSSVVNAVSDNSSKSDISDHTDVKNQQKIYYEYGNV